jgi:putative colanic acid biosysnthesis UDP-glucose lipid carrier transferase
MLHTRHPTSFVKQPLAFDSDGLSAHDLSGPRRERRKWPIHYDYVEPLVIAADVATVTASSVLCGLFYHLQKPAAASSVSESLGLAILVSALFVSLMKIRGMYRPTELLVLPSQIRAVCLTWMTALLVLTASLFALKIGSEISRGASILFAVFGLIALIAHRRIIRYLLARGLAERRFSGRKIVLITDELSKDDDLSQDDATFTQSLADTGFRVKKSFVLPPPDADPDHKQRLVASVIDYVSGSDVEEIVIGASLERWHDLRSVVAELRVLPFPVSFVPLGTASEIFKRPSHELGNAICVELQRGLLTSFEQAAKRSIDVLLAGSALIALLPLLTLVAIAIKLDSPGPILFRQHRCGFNGRRFRIYKFRTMSVLEDGPSVVQAQAGDKRFTRLGVWLRRTSVDELPQLVNVLNGSMALVGPRPHAVAHDNEFDKIVGNYAFRRRVKPGLTGWAQVHGSRGPTPTAASIEQRVQYDLWYIDNWSVSLDFAILLWTPIELVRGTAH